MSVQISMHANSIEKFLTFIKEKRFVPISEANLDQKILGRLNLTGRETRSFTDKEIKKILADYKYFEDFFRRKGLWPDSDKSL